MYNKVFRNKKNNGQDGGKEQYDVFSPLSPFISMSRHFVFGALPRLYKGHLLKDSGV